ncbi:hypothetical protein MPNT_40146 [Candidatus Methylacidithermus pantelleriae]|uniref:Uncharacterized protein n=1 Tax=Candidatus Methylacidithermus pantelleriae TaxID=2744239 RepID=A0A8J2FWU8_9BACT|nr:hypothetical protein MPNT_40146 [Candidatus Methylacidithermus pantelleriae]
MAEVLPFCTREVAGSSAQFSLVRIRDLPIGAWSPAGKKFWTLSPKRAQGGIAQLVER